MSYLPNPPRAWTRFQNKCPDLDETNEINKYRTNVYANNRKIPIDVKYLLPEYKKGNILQHRNNSANLTRNQKYALMAKGMWTNRNTTWATQSETYTNPNIKNLQRINEDYIVINPTNNSQMATEILILNVNCTPLPNKKTYSSLPSNSGDTQDPNDHPVVPPPLREKGDVPLLPPYIDTLPPKVETIIDNGGELICNVTVNPCTGEVTTTSFKSDCYPTTDSDVPGPIQYLCWNNGMKTYNPRTKRTYATSDNKWPTNYKEFGDGTVSSNPGPVLSYTTELYSSTISFEWYIECPILLPSVQRYLVYQDGTLIHNFYRNTTTVDVYDLITGVEYIFYIIALFGNLYAPRESNIINIFIPFPVFNINMVLQLTSNNERNIVLSWDMIHDGGKINGYKLFQNNDLYDTFYDINTKTISINMYTSFYSGQTISYYITSFSSKAESDPSNTVDILIPFPSITLSATLKVNPNNRYYVTLTWVVDQKEGKIDGYKIYNYNTLYSTENTETTTIDIGSNTIISGYTYRYHLKSYALNLESSPTDSISPIIIPFAAIQLNLVYNTTNNNITLNWSFTEPSGYISGFRIYIIDLLTNAIISNSVTNSTFSFDYMGNATRSYQFYVRSYTITESDPSNTVEYTFPIISPVLSYTFQNDINNSIQLRWYVPYYPNSINDITGFKIYVDNEYYGSATNYPTGTTEYDSNGNRIYTYKIPNVYYHQTFYIIAYKNGFTSATSNVITPVNTFPITATDNSSYTYTYSQTDHKWVFTFTKPTTVTLQVPNSVPIRDLQIAVLAGGGGGSYSNYVQQNYYGTGGAGGGQCVLKYNNSPISNKTFEIKSIGIGGNGGSIGGITSSYFNNGQNGGDTEITDYNNNSFKVTGGEGGIQGYDYNAYSSPGGYVSTFNGTVPVVVNGSAGYGGYVNPANGVYPGGDGLFSFNSINANLTALPLGGGGGINILPLSINNQLAVGSGGSQIENNKASDIIQYTTLSDSPWNASMAKVSGKGFSSGGSGIVFYYSSIFFQISAVSVWSNYIYNLSTTKRAGDGAPGACIFTFTY